MTRLPTDPQTIFESHKDDFRRRVRTLEEAVAAILAGNLDEQLRATAERDAQKLAGSLGMFGLPRGSELARELAERLAPSHVSVATDEAYLAEVVRGLRDELDDELAMLARDQHSDRDGSTTRGAVDASDVASQASDARELRRTMLETGLVGREPVTLSSGRILIVDDDVPVRQVLSQILSDAGYDVQDVGSAREARYVLEREKIALMLSDVSMPGETGVDLIRFALCEHPETATLLISALDDPGIAQVAIDFGAYGYLNKPVRRSQVLIGVMSALRRREVEARERATRGNLERAVTLRTSALSQALARLERADEHGRVLQAEAIHRWAESAEHREPGIARHVRRVSRYCAVVGRAFGLHPASLGLASVLHDVGTIVIPDSIVLKPAQLTADERLAMQTHAEVGYEMLRGSSSSLLDLAAVIARTHHEKFDGSGYPRGLSGADIPLEGRIVAVADVFDAMTCDRVYRPAWTVRKTTASMRRERGKHFDPDVLDAFLASMDEILAIRSDLTE